MSRLTAAVALRQQAFVDHASARRFLRGRIQGLTSSADFDAIVAALLAPPVSPATPFWRLATIA